MKTTTYEIGENGKLEQVQEYPVELNQIAYFHGYGNDSERLAVIKIETSEWGTNYHLLNLDKPELSKHQYLQPLETRRGTPIGIYFKQGELATQEEIDDVLPMAQAAEQMRQSKQAEEQKAGDEKRELAKKWWADNTPSWAKAYIVAELKVDKSDSMTDYFHASTSKTLLLSWSSTDRLNFAEMRKAGEGIPEIENLAELKEDRHHRILGNYYHGWTIKKCRIGGFNGYNDDFVSDPENIRLKKEITPSAPTGAQPTGGEENARIVINSKKQGIEIYFKSRPSDAVLDELKNTHGFRWGKFNRCWYRKDCSQARAVAARYGKVPEEVNQDASLVDAQEEAAIANGNY